MSNNLLEALCQFVQKRDWDQYHTPKNLATQLTIESAELLEHFRWEDLSPDEIVGETREEIAQELGDIYNCLLLLAHKLNMNLETCGMEKLKINGEKYPVELSKGKTTKYNKL